MISMMPLLYNLVSDVLTPQRHGCNPGPCLCQYITAWSSLHRSMRLLVFAGRTVLVTGGGSGMGLAMAIAFAQGGSKMGVVGRSIERAEEGVARIAELGGMVSFTKSMAVELSGHGIRVNCIAPDHTVTPGNQGNRAGPVDPANWHQPSPEAADTMNA